MSQLPQDVVQVFSPLPDVACFRVPPPHRLHSALRSQTSIPICKSKILVPDTAEPLLRNILGALQDFAGDIVGNIPVNYQLLRIELLDPAVLVEIIKHGRQACHETDMRTTILDRRSLQLVA